MQTVYPVTHGINTMYIVTEYKRVGQSILSDGSEYLCTECKNGLLFRDNCKRILKYDGGEVEWIQIPRHQCSNPSCKKVHRMLPDCLAPFKHYEESVIADALDDRIIPNESDYRPSSMTVEHWKMWLKRTLSIL